MKIDRIRINGRTNPIGYAFDSIRVSWIVSETAGKQPVYEKIEVSFDSIFESPLFVKEGADLNSACEEISLPLSPRTRYYVRVTVTADNGESALSDGSAFFETGKMTEPWAGKWIKPQPEDTFHPVFKKSFQARKPVKSARLLISGVGLYCAFLNGEQAGEEILTPYYSDYHTEVQYQTYDITRQIRKENTIAVALGSGWYKGVFGLDHKANNFGSEYQMIAELHLSYEDGSEEVISSDESWRYRGFDLEDGDGIYDGETINHLLWEGRENPWKTPLEGGVEGRLIERTSLPLTEQETMPVKEVLCTPAGETVLDFGQNFAGYVEFPAHFPKGTKVTLEFGEILQQGNFYRENYRSAKSRFTYVSDGREELVKPRFTYFGFRYVKVTGLEDIGEIPEFVGKALYSSMEVTGHLETGHAKINQLFSNVLWGQKSNSVDFPTDCPQRDERLGWTGDAQVFSGTSSYNMYTPAFYDKFLHDLRIEQRKLDGIVPGVIPVLDPNGVSYAAVWGDIATFLPALLYERFGDKKAYESYYPLMRDWVMRIDRDDAKRGRTYLFDFTSQMGDWLALDGRSEQSMKGGTDDYFIASCYYYMSAKKVSEAAGVLGYSRDEEDFRQLSERIREAVLDEYFTKSGRLAVDTQTAYIVSLYSGIYREKETIVESFRRRLYLDCFKLTGGFVGAPLMCKVMAENGMQQEAFYFLTQEEYPGWMHCVNLGATTIWERWNSVLDDGTLSGTMMNSLNHYAFGSVAEYLYRDLAGLKAAKPGFKEALIEPQINRKAGFLKLSYDSVYGRYRVEWQVKDDGSVFVLTEVPFGCKATVKLPYHPQGGSFLVESGVHTFAYQPTKNLKLLYNEQTLFGEMTNDSRAMEAIETCTPFLKVLLDSGDAEFLHENLAHLRGMFYMGFTTEAVDALAGKLLALEG